MKAGKPVMVDEFGHDHRPLASALEDFRDGRLRAAFVFCETARAGGQSLIFR